MFAGKAGAYPSEAPFKSFIRLAPGRKILTVANTDGGKLQLFYRIELKFEIFFIQSILLCKFFSYRNTKAYK